MADTDFPRVPPLFALHGADIFGIQIVHRFTNGSNINVDRALLDASSAAHTHDAFVVFIYEIFEFVHKTLAQALQFGVPGVVPGGVYRKNREHTAVPIAHALTLFAVNLVLDIKAPAGRAYKGAGAAVDA
jgi:hypothetical protein